ncbi:TAXI family TRAP transporter solute-binding subunit [Sphingobium subterraneum]|uniref:Uncharacterized protein n=1 Tax=Sphingobium subterraneum TaxID=627688 RepID=A0A841IWR6_9SPHN|nr:TAXI family TRAP transporter solute-binding subunit [Sphingobium subterraneum]MBB6123093.1 hypothetical protein [Sphingobium subterraneum]
MAISEPSIARSVTLQFNGDWGQANFHRICSWLTQEFCDRAGPRTRVGIWNIRGGGMEPLQAVQDGELDLCIATPAMMIGDAISGNGLFEGQAMPDLRALGVIPQNDRMVLAIDPRFEISSFEELRARKPALRIATSTDDGSNFIGRVARHFMAAHGIDEAVLRSWGGSYVVAHRPEQSLFRMQDGEVDAVLQEAIMTPWWRDVVEAGKAIPLPAEPAAIDRLVETFGYRRNALPAGFWSNFDRDLPAVDFSDFVIVVRNDMPADIAHLLTWCLVETRSVIEAQYRHIPPERSPITYPLVPANMCKAPIPLHAGAEQYYRETGVI